jgi:glycosyltransferase involved in cell wall biosynthesis
MKIVQLTPGTGSFHCGSCLRDSQLIRALRQRGHEAVMAPLYLPLVTDGEAPSPEQPVRVGGVSLYFQQKFPWFHKLPRFIHRWLDNPTLLRWASKRMEMTSARDLGEMTVGSLLGEKGRQWVEWEKLVEWVKSEKPDAISISTSLLIGLAPTFRERCKVPVVASLQGEDAFLDTLVEPYLSKAWGLMKENAKSVNCFISPSQFYADVMAPRLGVGLDKMAIIPNGLNAEPFKEPHRDPEVPTIGFLARMIHGKGLTTLVEAFILLAKRNSIPNVRLRIAGAKTLGDEKYLSGLTASLDSAGLGDRVTFEPNVSFEEKVKFLHEITVFSVPATYGEAFGIYVIEALASGAPLVQPRHGAFPEIIGATGGGVLCEPDDAESLCNALEELLKNPERRRAIGERGRQAVLDDYSAARMAERFEKMLLQLQGK